MTVNLGLERIGIDLVTEPIEDGKVMIHKEKRIPFLNPVSNQRFLDFLFETNPSSKPGVDKYIKLITNSLKLVFNPILIVRLN